MYARRIRTGKNHVTSIGTKKENRTDGWIFFQDTEDGGRRKSMKPISNLRETEVKSEGVPGAIGKRRTD